ncbi:MAG TPA: polymer-forming cytoskeletal protein [Rhodocyclaceae bacterium]|nr:polymer-forming cytoskeletal protein [Rhodocyclaceae bacterium]
MFWRKSAEPEVAAGSIIGKGTRIIGQVRFAGSLHVEGEISGSVSVPEGQTGTLTLGSQGRIDGEISGSRVVIDGAATGPAVFADRLELQSQARVSGDLHYGEIGIHPGAVVHGRLVHRPVENHQAVQAPKLAAVAG